jgi:(heptosyl)LPS beta-1,4-glucosyltransferase
MNPTLSAVVIARDEASMIERCLERLTFADETIVVVDDRTVDDTAERARLAGATVTTASFESFAELRNEAINLAGMDWILIVDADERVSADLAVEIRSAMGGEGGMYRVPIENWFYGARIRHSGYREKPIRLFRREGARFVGDIHEALATSKHETVGNLRAPLVHLSHRSVLHNLAKTSTYADVQARQMLNAGFPPITAWSLVRTAVTTLIRHLLLGRGFRDGVPGIIESFYQAFSIFCVHVRLWELQQTPSIEERYEALERDSR